MRAHVSLEVEISELIAGLKLEELLKLGIGEDAAAVLGVLELVGADVAVNLAGNLRAGHLRMRQPNLNPTLP